VVLARLGCLTGVRLVLRRKGELRANDDRFALDLVTGPLPMPLRVPADTGTVAEIFAVRDKLGRSRMND